MIAPETERELEAITDARLRSTMSRAIGVVALLALAAAIVLWIVWGWQTAVLLLVGCRYFSRKPVGMAQDDDDDLCQARQPADARERPGDRRVFHPAVSCCRRALC